MIIEVERVDKNGCYIKIKYEIIRVLNNDIFCLLFFIIYYIVFFFFISIFDVLFFFNLC